MIRSIVCAVLLLGALACDDPEPTQLVVLVNSNFQPVTELAHVQVAITSGGNTADRQWDIVLQDPGDREAVIPFSFGIVPPGGDAGARVDLTVTGLDPHKDMLVRRRVRVGFVAHQLRLLKIDLTQNCAERFQSCESQGTASAPRTCIDGECTSIDVDVDDLPRTHPGDELVDAQRLPWYCARGCDEDGGGSGSGGGPSRSESSDRDGSTNDRDGSPPKGGSGDETGPLDARVDSDSALPQAGSTAPQMPVDEGDDAGGDDDGGPAVSRCGGRPGFFGDVERPLTTTADGTLCVTVAQNRLEEGDTVEESTTRLTELLDKALGAELDLIELYVSEAASTLYTSGRYVRATGVPELSDILDYRPLRDSTHPLKLLITETISNSNDYADFARALLSLLLAKQETAAGGYASRCRPVYLMADNWQGTLALLKTQELLAAESDYAALRGHIHFGGYVAGYESASGGLTDIDNFRGVGFEFVDIEFTQKSLIPLTRYARSQGLQVFAREAVDIGLFVPLCGLVDALETPIHSYPNPTGTGFRDAISSSRTLVALDVAGVASDATEVPYSVQPPGTRAQSTLGVGTPSLVSGGVADPLPGTSLAFAAANQSLALNDPRLPASFNKLAVLALVRLDAASLPPLGRAVIASKRQGSTGWALELLDTGSEKVLQFEAFLRNGDSSVHGLRARISADALEPGLSHLVVAQVEKGTALRLRDSVDWGNGAPDFYYTVVENDAPLTLGSDPGETGNGFDGELQLFKLVSYAY